MPTPAEQTVAIDELRKSTLRVCPDLKDKAAFWKRKASVLKVSEPRPSISFSLLFPPYALH